jgi:acetylornithine deacetylase/succinyl-diaminopimelate desuccinylase-like protein
MALRKDPVVPMARLVAALRDHCSPSTILGWSQRTTAHLQYAAIELSERTARWRERWNAVSEHIMKSSGENLIRKTREIRSQAGPIPRSQVTSFPWGASDFLVCTVGKVTVKPGASNVIAATASITIDIRSDHDFTRRGIVHWVNTTMSSACKQARVSCNLQLLHQADAVHCDQRLTQELQGAAQKVVPLPRPARAMASGAGHDAMALAAVAPVAILFVRCKDGLSHTAEEFASCADVCTAVQVLYEFLQQKVLK